MSKGKRLGIFQFLLVRYVQAVRNQHHYKKKKLYKSEITQLKMIDFVQL